MQEFLNLAKKNSNFTLDCVPSQLQTRELVISEIEKNYVNFRYISNDLKNEYEIQKLFLDCMTQRLSEIRKHNRQYDIRVMINNTLVHEHTQQYMIHNEYNNDELLEINNPIDEVVNKIGENGYSSILKRFFFGRMLISKEIFYKVFNKEIHTYGIKNYFSEIEYYLKTDKVNSDSLEIMYNALKNHVDDTSKKMISRITSHPKFNLAKLVIDNI